MFILDGFLKLGLFRINFHNDSIHLYEGISKESCGKFKTTFSSLFHKAI